MKYAFISILIVHGLIHLLGFLREWKLEPMSQFPGMASSTLSGNAALAAGLAWLVVCVFLIVAAIGSYFSAVWWWPLAATAAIISQILIIVYWKDAKWGTVANLIVLIGVTIGYARWKFNDMVKLEVQTMYSSVSNSDKEIITRNMLVDLPAPVERWLTHSGVVGKPRTATLRLKQKGLMRSKPGQKKWSPMQAEQYFDVDNPAFIWKATMEMMPLVDVNARDKYVHGKGEMKIKILSLVAIANSRGFEVDQGALQRYLAEICWFPSAALASYIKWEAIDDFSARATLTYKDVSGSAVFHFNTQGQITGCTANRYMSAGKKISLEKWEVKTLEYGVMGGIRVPVRSEVTWKLKGGDFTWLKLDIAVIDYNTTQLY